jgi:hypothetical protein
MNVNKYVSLLWVVLLTIEILNNNTYIETSFPPFPWIVLLIIERLSVEKLTSAPKYIFI